MRQPRHAPPRGRRDRKINGVRETADIRIFETIVNIISIDNERPSVK